MSPLPSISSDWTDCCLDLLHLTACILMLVSDMNLSEQCPHWNPLSSVSSGSNSLRSLNISLFCSLPQELDFLPEVALVSAAGAARLVSALLSASSGGEASSVSRPD